METSGVGSPSSSGASGGKTMLLTPNSDNGSRSMDSSDWVSSPNSTNSGHHHHHHHHHRGGGGSSSSNSGPNSNGGSGLSNSSVPQLLLEIMNVEHLWHSNEQEAQQHRGNNRTPQPHSPGSGNGDSQCNNGPPTSGGVGAAVGDNDSVSSMCSIADHRLYKIVKWCKSLPLFKNIQVNEFIRFG